MVPLTLSLLGLVVAVSVQICGLIVAGRIVRVGKIPFGKATRIVLLWLLFNAACLLLGQALGLPTFLIGCAYLAGAVWIVKARLRLRAARALAVVIVALLAPAVVAFPVVLAVRLFVVAPFTHPSTSMQPTLLAGDRVLVNKLVYRLRDPQRWELAAFGFPDDPRRPFLKRVVAMPGESIEIRDGTVIINGTVPERPQGLPDIRWVNQGPFAQPGQAFELPADCYFVLGDYAAASHDSRFFGCVPRANFIGKALYIFSPPERLGGIR